jgi:hypothetical protein
MVMRLRTPEEYQSFMSELSGRTASERNMKTNCFKLGLGLEDEITFLSNEEEDALPTGPYVLPVYDGDKPE